VTARFFSPEQLDIMAMRWAQKGASTSGLGADEATWICSI